MSKNESISLAGNSQFYRGKQLVILFEKCSGSADCLEPSYVKNALARKSIVLFVNQRTLDQ